MNRPTPPGLYNLKPVVIMFQAKSQDTLNLFLNQYFGNVLKLLGGGGGVLLIRKGLLSNCFLLKINYKTAPSNCHQNVTWPFIWRVAWLLTVSLLFFLCKFCNFQLFPLYKNDLQLKAAEKNKKIKNDE